MKNSLTKLSYEVLKIANSEMPRSIFLKKISNLLIDWFKCPELKILLKIPKRDSQFELVHCTNDNFDYNIIHLNDLPQYLQVEENTKLWVSILDNNFDSSSTFFTEKGSFWIINFENISIPYRVKLGSTVNNKISKPNSNYSLLISPFLYSNERVGLIQLKNLKPEVFSNLGTTIFEEFSQTLSAILINQYTQALLFERVKELDFLYKMSNITKQKSISLDSIILQIIELIPPAWQYPEITTAKITLKDNDSTNTRITKYEHKLVSDIIVDKEKYGVIEVFYTEKCPEIDEGPFFYEERNLLNNIAAELATIISLKNTEKII